MLDDRRCHVDPFPGAGPHEVDAAARGIHFLAEQQIAWAGRKAEAAVDALVDQRLQWFQFREGVCHYKPPHPGARPRVWRGSNRDFTACMTPAALPMWPQGSTRAQTSAAASSTTALPDRPAATRRTASIA